MGWCNVISSGPDPRRGEEIYWNFYRYTFGTSKGFMKEKK